MYSNKHKTDNSGYVSDVINLGSKNAGVNVSVRIEVLRPCGEPSGIIFKEKTHVTPEGNLSSSLFLSDELPDTQVLVTVTKTEPDYWLP